MKTCIYLLTGFFLLLMACNTAADNGRPIPCPPTASFPCLTYSIDSMKKWDTSTVYKTYVFNPYDSSSAGPWQLICNGQRKLDSGCIYSYHLMSSAPFPTFPGCNGKIEDSTDLVFGNLEMAGDSLRKLINSSPAAGKHLLFTPTTYVDDQHKHLTYKLALVELSADRTTIVRRIQLTDGIFTPGTGYVVKDDDGEVVNLNPCPPHTTP